MLIQTRFILENIDFPLRITVKRSDAQCSVPSINRKILLARFFSQVTLSNPILVPATVNRGYTTLCIAPFHGNT